MQLWTAGVWNPYMFEQLLSRVLVGYLHMSLTHHFYSLKDTKSRIFINNQVKASDSTPMAIDSNMEVSLFSFSMT